MRALRNFFSFLFILLTSYFINPLVVHAQTDWAAQNSKCVANGDVATIQGIECLFFNVLQVIVLLAGLAFFFMFISGGFQYLLSQGDSKKVAASGSTLTMAFMGLIGVIGSWLILRLIENFTGLTLTHFIIPSN
ncbi:MAG: hypothetical protein NTY75_03585 [Candidatus Shapirobacteria bacterium]|nr:hypothetical protein [Candidatus Shapirobacteria bacterium]